MDYGIPLTGVVLFIAFGSLVFIIVFCFVKRQITRFTLRNSSGPHALIGSGAPKPLAAEIERRLKWVKEIMCEPRLLQPGMEEKYQAHSDPGHFIFRMKAIDSVALLDNEMKKFDKAIFRKPGMPMKAFLLEQRQVGPLEGTKLDLVEKFCNAYDHARHDPKEFAFEDYNQFTDLLMQLIVHIRNKCNSASDAGPAHAPSPPDQPEKPGKDGPSLTRGLQFRLSTERDGASATDEKPNPDNESTQGTKSQRMANYALAGEISLATDSSKLKRK